MLVIVTLLADVFFLPGRLAALVGMGFGYRLLVSGVILVPLGFVMGMPFPTGLRALAAFPAPEFPAGQGASCCQRTPQPSVSPIRHQQDKPYNCVAFSAVGTA